MPRDQWQAIESDLLATGFTLGDVPDRLTWRAIAALVKHCLPTSALYRAMHGDLARWQDSEHLLAIIADGIHTLAWQKTKAGQSGRNRPAQIERPGAVKQNDGTKYGTDAVTPDELEQWWEMS